MLLSPQKGTPYKNQKLPGKPAWYRDLWETGEEEGLKVSLRTNISPLLLRMEWVVKVVANCVAPDC
jgi:DNA polymerase gamma 1